MAKKEMEVTKQRLKAKVETLDTKFSTFRKCLLRKEDDLNQLCPQLLDLSKLPQTKRERTNRLDT